MPALLNVSCNSKSPLDACRTYILPSDLEEFLAPQEVDEAFHMLDENGNGKVSLHEIRDAVINIFNERRNLATSLKVNPAPCESR